MKWVRREEWQRAFDDTLDRHLASACANAGISIDELPDVIGDPYVTVAWSCAFEDFLAHDLDDGHNMADAYLKRRGWKESAANKEYISALRRSVMSLYEISGIVPEQSFLARDLVRGGEPVCVSERSGTRYLKSWDRIAARLVRVGARIEMAGGVIVYDYQTSEAVLKALRRLKKEVFAQGGEFVRKFEWPSEDVSLTCTLTDTELLRSSAFLFTEVWLDDLLQRTLHPTVPHMCNTDGDDLVFTRVSYPLKPGTSTNAIRLALAAIPELLQEGGDFWNWIGPNQPATGNRKSDGRIFSTRLSDGSVVLGTVALKGRMLVIEANSERRAQRGRALIAPVIAALVDEPVVEACTVDQLAASRPRRESKRFSSGLSPDEERAVVQAGLDQHYRGLLDQPVPMLGNVSPRRAAKSARGREKLVVWLKLLENHAARHGSESPMAGYDVTWMWEELGVVALRR